MPTASVVGNGSEVSVADKSSAVNSQAASSKVDKNLAKPKPQRSLTKEPVPRTQQVEKSSSSENADDENYKSSDKQARLNAFKGKFR